MKKLAMMLLLILIPAAAFGLEQTFTQNGLKATIKLTPDKPEPDQEITLSIRLERNGKSVTNKDVQLKVYPEGSEAPWLAQSVDVLDGEYIDSWKFPRPGTYRVAIHISDANQPEEAIQYEVKASVPEPERDHGFFSHHFGGKWGWWGAGAMALMMVPMMLLML